MSQLALPLRLADHAVFGSFLDTGNETLVATLKDLADGGAGQGCWIWGAPSTGRPSSPRSSAKNDVYFWTPSGEIATVRPVSAYWASARAEWLRM